MLSPDEQNGILPTIRAGQLIIGAMTIGLGMFLLVVTSMKMGARGTGQGPPNPPVMTYVAIAFAVLMLAASAMIPPLVVAGARRAVARGTTNPSAGAPGQPGDVAHLVPIFLTKTVIGAALVEGAGFFMGIAYLLERQRLAQVLTILLVLALAVRFPTRERVERWIEDQLQRIDQDRQRGA